MLKKLCLIGLLFLLSLPVWSTTPSVPKPSPYLTSLMDVGIIELDTGNIMCSGTIVSEHVILTAAHCFKEAKQKGNFSFRHQILHVVKLVNDNDDHVLVAVKEFFPHWATIELDAYVPDPGSDVFYWGAAESPLLTLRKGSVSGYLFKDGKLNLLLDVNVYFGDSGAGVFNGNNHVIGTINYLTGDPAEAFTFRFAGMKALAFSSQTYHTLGVNVVMYK